MHTKESTIFFFCFMLFLLASIREMTTHLTSVYMAFDAIAPSKPQMEQVQLRTVGPLEAAEALWQLLIAGGWSTPALQSLVCAARCAEVMCPRVDNDSPYILLMSTHPGLSHLPRQAKACRSVCWKKEQWLSWQVAPTLLSSLQVLVAGPVGGHDDIVGIQKIKACLAQTDALHLLSYGRRRGCGGTERSRPWSLNQ